MHHFLCAVEWENTASYNWNTAMGKKHLILEMLTCEKT